jgi:cytochrome c oxidase cbb3-type subunit 3
MSSFWSLWIIVLTSITIVAMTWILVGNRKRQHEGETERTTGHMYDGIEELDNPLPAWWFLMFIITIVWGVIYLIFYPGMGNFPGLLGWNQIDQHSREVAAADERYREMRDRYLALPIEEVAQDTAALKMGKRMFGNNCAQCHGADAKGSYGFPNLTDDDWIYGGTPDAIKTTLVNGRQAAMPGWGQIIGDQGVAQTTAYVLSLNGRDADEQAAAAGQKHFQTYCTACHGADGTGNTALGAPNLTNGVWLYGGSESQIAHSIRVGRNGQMPAFADQLGEDKIHIITAYVYSLSQD